MSMSGFARGTGAVSMLRQASLLLPALIGLLVLMPARAQAASEMPIPFNGHEAFLVSGPGHSVWFSSVTGHETTVEIAPNVTQGGTISEAFFGYFKGSSPVLVRHYVSSPQQVS